MIISFIILFGALILGFPIYMALLTSGMYLLIVELNMNLSSVSLVLYDSVAKFTLTAVPFFLLAGAILDNTSMAKRLIHWLFSVISPVRGGIPLVGVVANEFFGAISGSSAAATGTVGKILHPEIAKVKNESFAIGLLTSAGALAIIMPPSITMILYGATASVSVGDLFLTGIFPAAVIGVLLGGFIVYSSKKAGPENKFSLKAVLVTGKAAFWVIILPVIILGGIYGGIFTPTESAAVAAIYAFIVAVFIYREMGVRSLFSAIKDTSLLTTQIFIIIAASVVFSQALTLAHVPQQLIELTANLPPWAFLLFLNIVLLAVGMFFDPTSAVLVLTPLLVPVALHMGVDLIHLGMIMTVNLAIGMFTPPVGMNLFVAQGVFKKPMAYIINSLKPFWIWYLGALLIITYFPQLYMWIPELVKQ